MTQDEIIRMAREAGFVGYGPVGYKKLETFAALVAEFTGIEQQREIVRLKAIIEEEIQKAKARAGL